MSRSTNESKVDVLVVGAGPAGLMCAYALTKAGINVRIIEKRYVLSTTPMTPLTLVEEPRRLQLARQMGYSHEPWKCFRYALNLGKVANLALLIWRTRAMDWRRDCCERRVSYTWWSVQRLRPNEHRLIMFCTFQAFYNPDAHGGIQVSDEDFLSSSFINALQQRVARKADVSALSARYPFEVRLPGSMYAEAILMEYKATLHQGGIEAIFLDALKDIGHVVDRQTVPVSIQLSKDEAELKDASAYPVQVYTLNQELTTATDLSLT